MKNERAFIVTVRRVIVQEQTVVVNASTLREAREQARELAADLGEQHVAAEIGDWRVVR